MPKKQMIEDFADSVWISEIESGMVIYEEIYKDITKHGISSDMILNFLSALVSFASEVFADEIKNIKLSNHKILFDFLKQIMLVMFVKDNQIINEREIRNYK
ncbi:MAG: hypothetical protein EU535_06010 [Promethearchaeota archaeon]|nr:MAG: hypothetical protein EU535_06010 [Candidatus Lokiarchaeota archaeon]